MTINAAMMLLMRLMTGLMLQVVLQFIWKLCKNLPTQNDIISVKLLAIEYTVTSKILCPSVPLIEGYNILS